MTIPLVATHSCVLIHDGLRNVFSRSHFRPVRIALSLSEDLESYLRSLDNVVWLVGVDGQISTTTALVERVVAATPGLKAVILTAHQRPDDTLAALKAGARGVLCQDLPAEQLIKSLELIALGDMVIYPQFSWGQTANGQIDETATFVGTTTEPSSENQQSADVPSLSRRELIILRMLMDGASNKVIARTLVITESTVKVHMKAILRKLRLKNRTQAAIWARNHVPATKMQTVDVRQMH
jgi:two-component system, NarL family, nitrate/nitrite response regulator NarL